MSDHDYEQIKRNGEPTYWWFSYGGMMQSDARYTADEFHEILRTAFPTYETEIQGEDRIVISRPGLRCVFGGHDHEDGTDRSPFKASSL